MKRTSRLVLRGLLISVLVAFAGCALPSASSVSAQQPIPTPKRSKRLGMNFVPPAQPWLNRARDLGVYASRWQLNWQDVEPQEGNWTWDWADSEVYRIVEEGDLEAHLVLTLPPAWAREPGKLVPRNLYLAWDDPQNYWARYVKESVGHYGDRPVKYFEIWNEPDWDQYWQGSPADYYQLLKVAYRAAKSANPKAKIIMAGMAYWHNPTFWEQVLDLASKDPEGPANNYFFDIAAFHWYSRSELLYEKVTWARETLRRFGMDKPLWVNEVNVPLWGAGIGPAEAQPNYANAEEQAAFIIQAHANAFTAGAERVFFFRMSDDQMTEAFGLMRNDAKKREAFVAYQLMAYYLADAQPDGRVVENGVVKARFRGGDRERVVVLWNQTGRAVDATVPVGTAPDGQPMRGARLIDQTGSVLRLQASDSVYHVALPGATNHGDLGPDDYPIGGRTFILVEGSERPPASRMEPLPEMAPGRSFDVHWSAEDESGLGIASYDVQTRRGDAGWQDWLTGTTQTQATFTGQDGERYSFRVRARDNSGHEEVWRDTPDATTALLGVLAGSVRDLMDRAVAGARVCLARGECAETDKAGAFQFPANAPGVYELIVGSPADTNQLGGETRVPVQITLGSPVTTTLRLLPRGNLIPNGDFSGTAAPGQRVEADAAGNRRLVLRASLAISPTRQSYVVYVPPEMAHPVLAFDYLVTGTGGPFTAGVYRDMDYQYTSLASVTQPSGRWQHHWVDLTPYRGRYIEIEFAVRNAGTAGEATAYVDNVVVADTRSYKLFFPHVAKKDSRSETEP